MVDNYQKLTSQAVICFDRFKLLLEVIPTCFDFLKSSSNFMGIIYIIDYIENYILLILWIS